MSDITKLVASLRAGAVDSLRAAELIETLSTELNRIKEAEYTSGDTVILIRTKDGRYRYVDNSGSGEPTANPTKATDFSGGSIGSIRRNYLDDGDELVEYRRVITLTPTNRVL